MRSEPVAVAETLALAEWSSVVLHLVELGNTHVAMVEAGDVMAVVKIALRVGALQVVVEGMSVPQAEAASASRSSEAELAVARADVDVTDLGPTGALLVAKSAAIGEMAAQSSVVLVDEGARAAAAALSSATAAVDSGGESTTGERASTVDEVPVKVNGE